MKQQELHELDQAPKLKALKQLLNDCGIGVSDTSTEASDALPAAQHRVLVFCQLKSMIDLIETDLFSAHMPSVTWMRLDGTVDPTKRHSIVTKFNEDPTIDVLLLTTHVGGLGLNLTGMSGCYLLLFCILICNKKYLLIENKYNTNNKNK